MENSKSQRSPRGVLANGPIWQNNIRSAWRSARHIPRFARSPNVRYLAHSARNSSFIQVSTGISAQMPALWSSRHCALRFAQNRLWFTIHILSILTTLLEEWANTSKVDYTEQQQFNALKVDSAIDELLSDLHTMPTSDSGVCANRLRALQKSVVRLPTVPRLMW